MGQILQQYFERILEAILAAVVEYCPSVATVRDTFAAALRSNREDALLPGGCGKQWLAIACVNGSALLRIGLSQEAIAGECLADAKRLAELIWTKVIALGPEVKKLFRIVITPVNSERQATGPPLHRIPDIT